LNLLSIPARTPSTCFHVHRSTHAYIHTYIHTYIVQSRYTNTDIHTQHTYLSFRALSTAGWAALVYQSPIVIHTYIIRTDPKMIACLTFAGLMLRCRFWMESVTNLFGPCCESPLCKYIFLIHDSCMSYIHTYIHTFLYTYTSSTYLISLCISLNCIDWASLDCTVYVVNLFSMYHVKCMYVHIYDCMYVCTYVVNTIQYLFRPLSSMKKR
jgi:hypothetical protein